MYIARFQAQGQLHLIRSALYDVYINRADKMPLRSKSVKDICVKGGGGALYSLKKINRHKVGYATELL